MVSTIGRQGDALSPDVWNFFAQKKDAFGCMNLPTISSLIFPLGISSYQNVPSFFYYEAKISMTGIGDIPVAISFGGNFYVLVNIENLPRISNQISIIELTAIGARILDEVNRHIGSASI